MSASPSSSSGNTIKEIAQRALQANKEHQYALTGYAEQLQAQLDQLDKFLDTIESGDDEDENETPEIEVYIPGAKKPTGLFPPAEFLNPESPFYEDASRRMQYVNSTTVHPMKTKELEVLADAVKGENMRLLALQQQRRRRQEIAQEVPDIDLENNTDGIDWRTVSERVSLASDNKRTPDECRIKWLGDRHPRINHGEWNDDELAQLRQLVEAQTKLGKYNWVEIATKLGTNRTPLDCMRRGLPRQRHVWTPESDMRLTTAVTKFGIDNWNLVARYVSEDATASQCQGRYTRTLDPTIRRGAWSSFEDERLKQAVSAYGNSWIEVSSCVPGRNNDQCRERWNEQLNTNSTRNNWDDEEDARLRGAVGELGSQWKVVAERVGGGKTGQACRLRFDKLKKMEVAAIAEAAKMSQAPTVQTQVPSTSQFLEHQSEPQESAAEPTATIPPITITLKPRPRPRPRKANAKGKEKEQARTEEPAPLQLDIAASSPLSSPLSSLSASPLPLTPTIPLPLVVPKSTVARKSKRPATSSPVKSPGKPPVKRQRSSRKQGATAAAGSSNVQETEPVIGELEDGLESTASAVKGRSKVKPKPQPRGRRKMGEVAGATAGSSTSNDVEPSADETEEPPAPAPGTDPQSAAPMTMESISASTSTLKKRGRGVKPPTSQVRQSARLAAKQPAPGE
ncbi:hypothetical protein BDN72DRAFT_831595 [Pluteus cervinus]|uniref:Uncharacterized protein n=1 Tax=Pluteus cervinus TaxID=181527 RepID=A0ACD3BDA5_9AGAR|nr:hypothetical protein BDN72DRAFT_831595 [Pluteus cervinus]